MTNGKYYTSQVRRMEPLQNKYLRLCLAKVTAPALAKYPGSGSETLHFTVETKVVVELKDKDCFRMKNNILGLGLFLILKSVWLEGQAKSLVWKDNYCHWLEGQLSYLVRTYCHLWAVTRVQLSSLVCSNNFRLWLDGQLLSLVRRTTVVFGLKGQVSSVVGSWKTVVFGWKVNTCRLWLEGGLLSSLVW